MARKEYDFDSNPDWILVVDSASNIKFYERRFEGHDAKKLAEQAAKDFKALGITMDGNGEPELRQLTKSLTGWTIRFIPGTDNISYLTWEKNHALGIRSIPSQAPNTEDIEYKTVNVSEWREVDDHHNPNSTPCVIGQFEDPGTAFQVAKYLKAYGFISQKDIERVEHAYQHDACPIVITVDESVVGEYGQTFAQTFPNVGKGTWAASLEFQRSDPFRVP